MAQTTPGYTANWTKVAAFEKKGLTQSALAEVISIYKMALKDKNAAQQIKSAMYQVKYRNSVAEDSREINLLYIDTLINTAKAPAKNILQSMQAELYWQYLQQNRHRFYNRTALVEEKSNDIATWSLAKIHAAITQQYMASLNGEPLLQSTGLTSFDPVIIKGKNTRGLRPTLYDFLAHRALDYYMNDERDLVKPAYQFTINDKAAFAPANEFAQVVFPTQDTGSLQHKAIKILQQLILFHLPDSNSNALLDVDLKRLQFVHEHAFGVDKNSLYEQALKNMEATYTGNAGVAQAMYMRARLYVDKGNQYHRLSSSDYQYELKKAAVLCDEVIKKYPASEGAINCHNLMLQVRRPSLRLRAEKVNLPGQPFKALLFYKNTPAVYFRAVKVSHSLLQKLSSGDYTQHWKEVLALAPLAAWNVVVPDLADHQEHATEIKINALPVGKYFIISSLDAKFSMQGNILAKQLVHVSNISFVSNNTNSYYVLHRETGQPLPGTKVQVWENSYNYATNKNMQVKAESYTTDNSGHFKIRPSTAFRQFQLQLNYKTDELFMEETSYSDVYNGNEAMATPTTFLFTDRSIYRPGQTVYFKGIVVQKAKPAGNSAVVADFKVTLQVKDANGQKITTLQMMTNAFGSYHGSFKLPQGLLNGQFSLSDETTNTTQYIQVEEYKRPGFSIELTQPTGSYRLYDTVSVKGVATAYAGNPIGGAVVKYRVVRRTRFTIWNMRSYGSRIFQPERPTEAMEITNGTQLTNDKGEFKIDFNAIPDETLDKKNDPVFNYEITVDITDINGETRSSDIMMGVGYKALTLNIAAPEQLNTDSLHLLYITSTNTNGIYKQSKVTVTLYQLQAPGIMYRERFWELPDQFVMSREEYTRNFPQDAYYKEADPVTWTQGEKVKEKTDTTTMKGTWFNQRDQLPSGWYKVVATARDEYGEAVETIKIIYLSNPREPNNTASLPVEIIINKETIAPGEPLAYSIRTGFENTWLLHTISKPDTILPTDINQIKLNKPFQLQLRVTEKDRGGIAVSYLFVRNNRVYKGEQFFNIPWSNKQLTLRYKTFRDKLLPGSKEQWTATISGKKGEQVAAEMLVSMYDASLDQFLPHSWRTPDLWPLLNRRINWQVTIFGAGNSDGFDKIAYNYRHSNPPTYDQLLSVYSYYERFNYRDLSRRSFSVGNPTNLEAAMAAPQMAGENKMVIQDMNEVTVAYGQGNNRVADTATFNTRPPGIIEMPVRKNFNETAFFFPALTTDSAGNVSFNFTLPEALTTWKLMTLAHTKDMASSYLEQSVIAQKPLMVQPNTPRFMREGDRMEFSAKVVNMSEQEITGTTQLELLDAATNKPVDGWFKNVFQNQYFTVGAGQSVAVKFPLEIPFNFNSALVYRVTATSANRGDSGNAAGFSDGEEMVLPVLTNRMLVTESMPLNLRNHNEKHFTFDKLLNSKNSNTLAHHAVTVEFTTNPVWYAVQALPYLMEFPYDCAEQTFNRYYANTLASFITTNMPGIRKVFTKWQADSATVNTAGALLSNLQKNEELKAALLQETPWVLRAQNEQEQKKQIALLFDMVKMGGEQRKAIAQLKEMQHPTGGFVWFKGGPDDRYMTQYIVTGIGHLLHLKALPANDYDQLKEIVDRAIPYLDKKIKDDHDQLVKNKAVLKDNHLGYIAIQYLYMRSFFNTYAIPAASQPAYKYYRDQAKKFWLNKTKYMQGMIALALHRTEDAITPVAIIKSLKQNAIYHDELGMYWKEWSSGGGYFWHQAPIESQAMMIEAFTAIDKNSATINDLKTWLLKQKQTQHWKTTRATAEACYALLWDGDNNSAASGLLAERSIQIQLGSLLINSSEEKTAAGSGYFKRTLNGEQVTPSMGKITVTLDKNENVSTGSNTGAWGAVYWQYFEDLDKITTAATPLVLTKQLFIEKHSDQGPVLHPVGEGVKLTVGDKVKVRIQLKADRDMEYIHLKDMRASGMEPTNVISRYKYQGGLGYYESTKDASTDFFIGWLPRGTYVFEYPLVVAQAGNFSNGITTIQCMYAPEFTSHSEGIRVQVEAPQPSN